jgi:hypothetical protein
MICNKNENPDANFSLKSDILQKCKDIFECNFTTVDSSLLMYDAIAIGTYVVKELATSTYFNNPHLQHQYHAF